jgi:hypothetical protein
MAEVPHEAEKVVELIRDVGGTIVGTTRLQKTMYFLQLAGLANGFDFANYHYGPHSEDLARAVTVAHYYDLISKEEKRTDWGGYYSIYSTKDPSGVESNPLRRQLARKTASANSVVLELAASAAFFSKKGVPSPWHETQVSKPYKACDGRLEEAKELYAELRGIVPELPQIS